MDWETKYYEETGNDAASDKWDSGYGGYLPKYNSRYVEWLEGKLDNSNPPKSEQCDSKIDTQQTKVTTCPNCKCGQVASNGVKGWCLDCGESWDNGKQ